MISKTVRESFDTNAEGIISITDLVRGYLKKFGIKDKEVEKAVLVSEEVASVLVSCAREGAKLNVRISSFFGKSTVEISSEGSAFSLADRINIEGYGDDHLEEDTQEVIRSIVIKSYAEDLKYHNSNGKNKVSFTIRKSPKRHLYLTIGSMIFASVVGIILSEFGLPGVNKVLDEYIFIPGKTMFMNALKIIVAPVVFFSIVSCIVQFSNIRELGRIGLKVLGFYFLTTLLAISVGILMYHVFKPGSGTVDLNLAQDVSSISTDAGNVSLKDTIVNIVPSNFVQPFVQSDMLQLIFLAILCGIAAGGIGRYSSTIKNIFETLNELFLKITTYVIKFMPIAVFCAICSMMLHVGKEALLSVVSMLGTFVLGIVVMMVIYSLLILILGHLNPIYFLKNYIPVMLQVFSMASSNASIPVNMKACDDMGVNKKIYSLSIPLGATVNMDGTCVQLAVFSLALAHIYGVPVTGASLLSLVFSIIVLSVGAPGIPGAGLICLSVLITQIGVPVEAIGLVMGIDALVGMFRCMNNCTGDVVGSIVVSKVENMLDIKRYKALEK